MTSPFLKDQMNAYYIWHFQVSLKFDQNPFRTYSDSTLSLETSNGSKSSTDNKWPTSYWNNASASINSSQNYEHSKKECYENRQWTEDSKTICLVLWQTQHTISRWITLTITQNGLKNTTLYNNYFNVRIKGVINALLKREY